ncbi:hypothetical protein Ancab_034603 [Ancistrocladus abbreviatus]
MATAYGRFPFIHHPPQVPPLSVFSFYFIAYILSNFSNLVLDRFNCNVQLELIRSVCHCFRIFARTSPKILSLPLEMIHYMNIWGDYLVGNGWNGKKEPSTL